MAKEQQREAGGSLPQISAKPPIDIRLELAKKWKESGVNSVHGLDRIKDKWGEQMEELENSGDCFRPEDYWVNGIPIKRA